MLAILVGFSLSASADWPVRTPKKHESIKKYEQLIRRVNLEGARVSTGSNPDSALLYSWDGATWTLDNAVGIRYQNGLVSRMIIYISGLPIMQYVYTYNPAGKATLIEAQLSIPGQPMEVITRFQMGYDLNGNQTSMLIFERDSSGLRLESGDSLQIIYSGTTPTEAVSSYYGTNMNGVARWMNSSRLTGFTFSSNGEPTAVTMTPWDESISNWSTSEAVKYSDVQWKFGYGGFSLVFGGLVDISQFLFTELPFAESNFMGEPTDFVEEMLENGSFSLYSRITSTMSGTQVSQILRQLRDNNTWVDDSRMIYSYNNGNLVLAIDENWENGSWVANYRDIWSYDANNNLVEERFEFFSSGAWVVGGGSAHQLNYTNDGRVFRWVRQFWDGASNSYVNEEKREYFFGGFALSSSALSAGQGLKIYPNPANEVTTIELINIDNESCLVQVFDLNGRLVMSEAANQQQSVFQLNVSHLAKGMYRVTAKTSKGLFSQNLVKY